MSLHTNKSVKMVLIPAEKKKSGPSMSTEKKKSGPSIAQHVRAISKQHLRTPPRKTSAYYEKKHPERLPLILKKSNPENDRIIVPATSAYLDQDHTPPKLRPAEYCISEAKTLASQLQFKPGVDHHQSQPLPQQFRPLIDSRVMMINKACHVIPELQDAAQYTNTCSNELYQELLIQQYGFNPAAENVSSELLKPAVVASAYPKIENSSQCANPTTTTTGTNGTAIELDFSNLKDRQNSMGNCLGPKNIEIAESPRIKVIAEKFTRFKKDRLELRQLEERIICLEYDVYNRENMVRAPAQVMRAFFCVKTGCEDCKGALINNVHIQYNLPLDEESLQKMIETEVEIIDEKLPENKPYLKDLQAVLKKRRAVSAKKRKSNLDLLAMYTMAFNEMPPRDHDWSHTNLLSRAELDEVKHLILRKCESRVHNLSRKKIKVKPDDVVTEPVSTATDQTDSLCCNLLRDLSSHFK